MWVCQSLHNPELAIKHDVIFKLQNSSCSCDQSLFSSASKLLKTLFESQSPDKDLGSSLGIKIRDRISPDKLVISLEESAEAFGVIHRYLHNPDSEIDASLLPAACQLAKKLEFYEAWCVFARQLLNSISLDNIGEICPLIFCDPKHAIKEANTEFSALETSLSDAAVRFIREHANSIACSQNGQVSACLYVDVISPALASQMTTTTTSPTATINSDEDAFVASAAADGAEASERISDQLTDCQLTDCVLRTFADQEAAMEAGLKESGFKLATKIQAAAKGTVTEEIRLTLTEAQLIKPKTQRPSQDSLSSSCNGSEAAESTPQQPVTPDTETCLIAQTGLGVGSISIHLGKLGGRLVSLSVKRVYEQPPPQQQQQQNRWQPCSSSTAPSTATVSRASSISESSSRHYHQHHQGSSVILPPSPVLCRNGNITADDSLDASPLETQAQFNGPDEQLTIVADDGRMANLMRLCSEASLSSPNARSRCSVLRSVGCLRNRLSLARSAAGACSISPAVALQLPQTMEVEDSSSSSESETQQQQPQQQTVVLLAGGYTQNGCLDAVELLKFFALPGGDAGIGAGSCLSLGVPAEVDGVGGGGQTTPPFSDCPSSPGSSGADELDFCTLPGPRMHCARGRLALTTISTAAGDTVFACGGSDGSKDLSSVECISTAALARWIQHQQQTSGTAAEVKPAPQESIVEEDARDDEWRLLASLQQARSCAAAAVIDASRVVVLGGQISGKPLSSVEVYEAERNEWVYLPQMLEARTQLCSATVPSRNLVLAVGGISNAAGGAFVASPQPTFESDFHGLAVSAEAFDYRCPRWFRLPEPISRGSLIGGTLVPLPSSSGRVMLIGGSDGHSALTQTQIFDLRAWTWLAGPNLAVGRFSPSAVLLSGPGSIAVIGGYNVAAGGFLNSVEVVSVSDCGASPACLSPWASVSLCPPPPVELLSPTDPAAAIAPTSSAGHALSVCSTYA